MSTTTLVQSHDVGDLVTANPELWGARGMSGVYVITKAPRNAREVNYTARPKDVPTGRGLKGPADAFLPYVEGSPVPGPVVMMEYVPIPACGTIVKVMGDRKIADGTAFVILGSGSRPNCAKIARLGGENDRYYPNYPMRSLHVVPMSDVVIG